MQLITISRETGSLGDEIGRTLAERMNLPHITRSWAITEWFPEIANAHELHMLSESPAYFLKTASAGMSYAAFLQEKLKAFVDKEPAIISGMGAQIIFRSHPEALHVRIMGSRDARVRRFLQTNNLVLSDAERIVDLTDRKHRRYIQTVHERDWTDPLLYHLTLNTDTMDVEEAARFVECIIQHRKPLQTAPPKETSGAGEPIHFKNASEEEFAKILNMYNLEWSYEPRTFPIAWDAEGNITQAFSPDFYLPRFDTYLELTVMNQKYTATKKKKAQLLRKLYPGINIRIVFKEDFHTLIQRLSMLGGE